MKKRIISTILALAMCIGLFPATAQAAEYTVTEILPCIHSLTSAFSEGFGAVLHGGKWRLVDKTGKNVDYIWDSKYDGLGSFQEGLADVWIDTGETNKYGQPIRKFGYIDKNGEEVVPCKYDYTVGFSESMAMVRLDEKWGFIDRTGKEVVPCKYYDARSFSDGMAKVWDGYWGFIDKAGKEVIPCQYYEVGNFSDGLAYVRSSNVNSFIDKTGKEVIKLKYEHAYDFSEGLARVESLDGKYGYIDKTGKEVIPCECGPCGDFSDGLAFIWRDDKIGYIDKTGKEVIPCKYEGYAHTFSDGLVPVCSNGKWGVIDKTGREVVPFKYTVAGEISEGIAEVGEGYFSGGYFIGSWGYISIDATVSGFTDVKVYDYYADAVQWAVEKGVTTGTSQTTFSPNENCTVAQILTFLWRANGSPKPAKSNPFSDVKSGDYYADAAAWAYEKGMVSGRTFDGGRPCTRSMAVTYMWKAAGSPSAKAAGFVDVPAGAEYAKAVAWAVDRGVTNGTSTTAFSPNDICTRGQIVTFLHRGLA